MKHAAIGTSALLLVVAGVSLTFSSRVTTSDIIETTPIATPILLPVALATAQPIPLTYERWRSETPLTIVTEEELRVALIEAGIPHGDSAYLASLAVNCEAPARQRDGVSIGARMDARGDEGGRSQGPLQINTVAHPWATNLNSLTSSAAAAARVYWMQGTEAWSCR